MKKKLHYTVSFDIDVTVDDEYQSMNPDEIKPNIKFWLEGQFRDYFDKFKIKNLKCSKRSDMKKIMFNEQVLCETALNFVVDFLNKNEICLVPYKNYNEIGDGTWNGNHFNCNDLTEAFEAGYRKALKQ